MIVYLLSCYGCDGYFVVDIFSTRQGAEDEIGEAIARDKKGWPGATHRPEQSRAAYNVEPFTVR